ncbi:MAG: tetratricopeptide repeat protein [Treponema sp.]|nr:tetratricopeptide repeat protein [Treponema sp.]
MKKAEGKTSAGRAAGAGASAGRAAGEKASPAQEKLNRAIQAGIRRDYPAAVAILEELVSEYDTPPEAYLFLGRSFHVLKQYSKALAAFNDYLRLRPRDAEGYLFAGRTYLSLGMPQRAAPLLRKALEYRGGDPLVMALLGLAYLKSKHSQNAVDMLQAAVEKAPENKRIYRAYLNALLVRGIRLCRIGDYHLGAQMLRFVLANGLDLPLLRLELGRAARETGELDEAVEHYSAALIFNPRDLRIRWYRASILMALDRSAEALEDIAYIRSLDGNLPDLPWNSRSVDMFMIRSFLGTGDWRRAADACRNWIKHQGAEPMVHTMYAEALRNMKEYAAALNHLERALELVKTGEPGPAPDEELQLRYEQILAAWEGADWQTLGKALRRIRALGGDRDIIARFSILYEAKTNQDDRGTLSLLQNAIRSLGPEPELMYALGERYLKIGLIEEALSWFKKTILLQPNHEAAYLGAISATETLFREGLSPEDALEGIYTAYLAHWPDNRSIRREWALFLIHRGEFLRAAGELEALLVWDPANPTLRRVLAYTYRKTGRFREAAGFIKPLLKEKPRNINLLLEYALCLERAGASRYAQAVLEKAMDFFKKSPDIPMALSMILYRRKQVERAFDLLREAAARNLKDPRPYEWMAFIARKNKDKEGARRYEQEAEKRQQKKKDKKSKIS